MKNIIIYFTILFPLAFSLSSNKFSASELTIYTYNSFNSEWGPGPIVFKKFEKICGCNLKVISPGDSGQVLNRTILEKENPRADILLGLNNSEIEKSFHYNLWEPYKSKLLYRVPNDLIFDKDNRVTPFDYGFLAFVYDSQKINNPPKNLKDLLDVNYKKKIVIQNPRTSSPGLSFLHWTIAEFGQENFIDFWKKFRPNLLAVTDGWSAAYGMFTRGEIPIVLSYVTSPAYHLEHENTERYQVAHFKGGHYRQVEFGGIIKGTKNLEQAQDFIDFMLSEEFQKVIPLTNWMFPVIEYVDLPSSFQIIPKIKKKHDLSSSLIFQSNSKWIKSWSRAMSE